MKKQCLECLKEKDLEEFAKEAKGKLGRTSKCKECRHKLDATYRITNSEKLHLAQAKWRKSNPDKMKQNRIKSVTSWHGKIMYWKKNARHRKIEWNLTAEYIQSLPFVCCYTGVALTLEIKQRNTASLDRIDSAKGYIEGNVELCASRINLMKMGMTKDEFKAWCKDVVSYSNQ